eukprot:963989-Amphidinium_carterae.1
MRLPLLRACKQMSILLQGPLKGSRDKHKHACAWCDGNTFKSTPVELWLQLHCIVAIQVTLTWAAPHRDGGASILGAMHMPHMELLFAPTPIWLLLRLTTRSDGNLFPSSLL